MCTPEEPVACTSEGQVACTPEGQGSASLALIDWMESVLSDERVEGVEVRLLLHPQHGVASSRMTGKKADCQ